MRVVVTGGCGFIGSHVAELLVNSGYEVLIIDNLSTGRLDNIASFASKVTFIQADLAQKGAWQDAFTPDCLVVHLAALADIVPSIQKPEDYYNANVTGTFNVLQAAFKANAKKLIYAASASCYGLSQINPTPETAPTDPQYPYALTKKMGEDMVMHWNKVYQIPSLSLRFFNVYGPRSRTSGTYGAMFGIFLAQRLAKKPYTVIGDGNQSRDFIYVSDLAEAIKLALESNRAGEIYNVGRGEPITVNRIVDILDGPKVFIPKRPGEPDSTQADISKIKKHLGWSPKIKIEEGIAKLLEHIDYWKNAPVWEPDSIARETKDWFKYLGEKS